MTAETLRELQEVSDLLAERIYGNPARSTAHNARVKLEGVIVTLSASSKDESVDEVERIAKAIYDATHTDLSNCYAWDDTWEDYQEACRERYYKEARAALSAINSRDAVLREDTALLSWIVGNYASGMSHVDFRVEAYRRALASQNKSPKEGEFAGIPLSELARSGAFGWHPGDEA